MKLEQQQQAQDLYFQTDLTKTEIADQLNISRRTLHYWIQQNNWERLKKNAELMPSCLAENGYRILGDLMDSILSQERIGKPATPQEINSINKLTNTIHKLRTRSTLNESMELLKYFTESIEKEDSVLAEMIQPEINKYVTSRAAAQPARYVKEKPIVDRSKVDEETRQDALDLLAWLAEERANEAKAQQAAENDQPVPQANTSTGTAPIPTQPQTPNNQKPKVDLRKMLRGTATTGPCKNLPKYRSTAA